MALENIDRRIGGVEMENGKQREALEVNAIF